jgi:hypothetical protein
MKDLLARKGRPLLRLSHAMAVKNRAAPRRKPLAMLLQALQKSHRPVTFIDPVAESSNIGAAGGLFFRRSRLCQGHRTRAEKSRQQKDAKRHRKNPIVRHQRATAH